MRRWLLIIGMISLPILYSSCLAETDYSANTGTLTIPWGEKVGTRNPEEALP